MPEPYFPHRVVFNGGHTFPTLWEMAEYDMDICSGDIVVEEWAFSRFTLVFRASCLTCDRGLETAREA